MKPLRALDLRPACSMPPPESLGTRTGSAGRPRRPWTIPTSGRSCCTARYVYHIIMNTFVSFPTVKSNKKLFFLYSCRCLHHFDSIDKLDAHDVNCRALNDCAIRLPSEEDKWRDFPSLCTLDAYCGRRNRIQNIRHTHTNIMKYLTSDTTCGVRTTTHYPSIDLIAIPIASHDLSRN